MMNDQTRNMCDFCEKIFDSIQDLELHIKQIHIQLCPEATCGKSFQSGSELLSHYTQMHKNYQLTCDKCEKIFSCPKNTVGHKILCTECLENGEFYKCNFCSQTFTSKILQTKHSARSHKGKKKHENDFSNNEKKSKCGNCGEGFRSLDLLDLTENSSCDLVCKLNKIILAQNELIKGLLDKVKNKENDGSNSNVENEFSDADVIDIKEEWQKHFQE